MFDLFSNLWRNTKYPILFFFLWIGHLLLHKTYTFSFGIFVCLSFASWKQYMYRKKLFSMPTMLFCNYFYNVIIQKWYGILRNFFSHIFFCVKQPEKRKACLRHKTPPNCCAYHSSTSIDFSGLNKFYIMWVESLLNVFNIYIVYNLACCILSITVNISYVCINIFLCGWNEKE